jgi:hypothetical protein
MEYYFQQFKKDKSLSFLETQMSLQDIMLSELTQAQKDKNHMVPMSCRF